MTRVDVLTAALTALEKHGWTQHQFRDERSGAMCASWAVTMTAVPPFTHLLVRASAYGLLEQLTGTHIPVWNDAPDRTFPEVRALYQAAIAIAQQDAPEPVEV